MKKLNLIAKSCLLSSGLVLSVFMSSGASAAAIQLFHAYSAVATGDGDSGGAAMASDASTTYSNPAGLIRVNNPQLILGAVDISTDIKFTGTNTWRSSLFPPFSYSQTGTAQGGMSIIMPSIFYSIPLSDRLTFGLSTASPFGLKTTYGNSSIVRYSGVKGEVTVIDLSPALGYKLNDHFSVGGALDFDRIVARIDAMVGLPPSLPGFGPALDTLGQNNAYGWGVGGHVGLLYQYDQQTRFGLAYRSHISSNLQGFSTLTGPLVVLQGVPSGNLQLRNFHAKLAFPPVTTLSGYHAINSQWAIQGTVNYVQWSNVPGVLSLVNLPGFPPITPVTVTLPQHYRNTWYVAGGANFKANEKWLLRAGLSFDQTPVKNSERNIFLPDGNRIGTSIGAHYQFNKYIGFDGGWTHLFLQNVSINLPTVIATQTSTTTGSYKNHADLLAAQIVCTFA